MDESKLISVDFNLPNHEEDIVKADVFLKNVKKRFGKIKKSKNIDEKTYTLMFDDIIRVLDFVGLLSEPAFAIENDLEYKYMVTYPNSPSLAKLLWLKHYAKIHHPYDILKNRCHTLIDELDEEYFKYNKKYPPNWIN
jgi:hypothetical protein